MKRLMVLVVLCLVTLMSSFAEPSILPTSTNQVRYDREGAITNITMLANFNSVSFPTDTYATSWTEDKGSYQKFAFNFSLPNDLTGDVMSTDFDTITFNVVSPVDLEMTSTGVRYLLKTVQDTPFTSHNEYVVFDFNDIANTLLYEEEVLDPDTLLPTGLLENVSIPYSITTDRNTATLTFNVSFLTLARGKTIVLDPTISIVDVSNYTSANNNITTEPYPLSHISINDTGLVAYYPFDVNFTAANITYDYTINNLDGTRFSDVRLNHSGYIGSAAFFPAGQNQDDYITIGTGSQFGNVCTNGCSFSAFVNIADGVNAKTVIGKADTNNVMFAFEVQANEAFKLTIWQNATSSVGGCLAAPSGVAVNFGRWEHIVGVYNNQSSTGSNITVYINGTEIGNAVCAFKGVNVSTWQSSESTFIGTVDDSSISQEFNGSIDEVMIWNRSITKEEVLAIYKSSWSRYAGPPATQRFENLSIGQDGTLNMVNITTNTTQLNNSNLSLMVLEYNLAGANTANSSLLYLSNGAGLVNYTISTSTYNLSLQFNYTPGGQNFYSPLLHNNIIITSFTFGALPPTIYQNASTTIVLQTNGQWTFTNHQQTTTMKQ